MDRKRLSRVPLEYNAGSKSPLRSRSNVHTDSEQLSPSRNGEHPAGPLPRGGPAERHLQVEPVPASASSVPSRPMQTTWPATRTSLSVMCMAACEWQCPARVRVPSGSSAVSHSQLAIFRPLCKRLPVQQKRCLSVRLQLRQRSSNRARVATRYRPPLQHGCTRNATNYSIGPCPTRALACRRSILWMRALISRETCQDGPLHGGAIVQ